MNKTLIWLIPLLLIIQIPISAYFDAKLIKPIYYKSKFKAYLRRCIWEASFTLAGFLVGILVMVIE